MLAEYFQPEPKEISKALRNVKGAASRRRRPLRLAPMLATLLLLLAAPVEQRRLAQDVERSELPPLPGAAAARPRRARPAPPPVPGFPAPPAFAPPASGPAVRREPVALRSLAGVDAARARAAARCDPACRPRRRRLPRLIARALADRRSGERTGPRAARRRFAACRPRGRAGRAARPRRGGQRAPALSAAMRWRFWHRGARTMRARFACGRSAGQRRRCSSRSIVPRRGATCRERSLRFSLRVTAARRWGWPPPRSPA